MRTSSSSSFTIIDDELEVLQLSQFKLDFSLDRNKNSYRNELNEIFKSYD